MEAAMRKASVRANRLGIFFLMATLFMVVTSVPEAQVLDNDVVNDTKEYAKAGDVDSIATFVASNPALAVEIAKVAVKANPGMAIDIACRIAGIVPDKAVEIAGNTAKAHVSSIGIAFCIAEAVPQFAAKIAASVADVVPHKYAADIAGCVAEAVPDRAKEIAAKVIEVAPEYEESIKERVADAIAFEEEAAKDHVPPLAPPPPPYGQ